MAKNKWLALALEQVDDYEAEARRLAEALNQPPRGATRAIIERERRRRARVEKYPTYVQLALNQIAHLRAELAANPKGAKLAYHAMMVGMLAQYPDTADVRAAYQEKLENAKTSLLKK